MNNEIICKRCGLCCHLIIDGVLSAKLCRNCVPMGNNRYACRLYQNKRRVGTDIGFGNKCHERESVPLNYVNCPYNQKIWGKELVVGDSIEKE